MTNILIKLFVKNSEDTKNAQVIKRYGFLCGGVGIATNTLLSVLKIFIGLAINSIAVTADAVNNLSDIGSSIVTIIGFYAAGKPADEEHPFGHGRAEYLSALFISIMIIMVGIQFLRTSWERIRNPIPIEFSMISLVLLILSILAKIWQSGLYKKIGIKINSNTLKAAAMDSISDVATTSIVALSILLTLFVDWPIDGYIGLVVSALIIYNGWNIVKEVIDPILGTAPDQDLIHEIETCLQKNPGIMGSHDLVIHNYGAGKLMATVHAEVSDSLGLVEAHEIIDAAEKKMFKELGIIILIHMDPIDFDDPKIKVMFDETKKLVRSIDKDLDIHDFRVIPRNEAELIFDMVVPVCFSEKKIEETKRTVEEFIKKEFDIHNIFIEVDRGNIII